MRHRFRSAVRAAMGRIRRWADVYLNYFRVHMLYFIVMTLFWSAILYASNTKDHHVPYIDCLFLSASAMTVTGLVTVPASQLTLWQQIILFCLMCCGNLIIVSTTTVMVRRHWFRIRFQRELERSHTLRKRVDDVKVREQQIREDEVKRVRHFFRMRTKRGDEALSAAGARRDEPPRKLHAGMVQRVQGPAVQVNPTGHHTKVVHNEEARDTEAEPVSVRIAGTPRVHHVQPKTDDEALSPRRRLSFNDARWHEHKPAHAVTQPHVWDVPHAHTIAPITVVAHDESAGAMRDVPLPHARTWHYGGEMEVDAKTESTLSSESEDEPNLVQLPGAVLHRTLTQKRDRGLGGFPTIIDFLVALSEVTRLRKRTHMPYKRTMTTVPGDPSDASKRFAPYLTFDATVTGNSHFHNLTSAQRRELGGVEYRALTMLCWLIPLYWISFVLLVIVFTAPYLASSSAAQYRAGWNDQPKPPRNSTWFWIFETVSAMTNCGMSLSDASLTGSMHRAYMVVIPQIILIIVGNTGFPVALRFLIWCMSKCCSRQSRTYETLTFLLDHPRRCYLYLFPSQNTWILLITLVVLTISDWFLLMITDLGTRHHFASNGTWVLASLFQSVSTRSSGFQTFNIQNLTPCEQILEVVMMYISAFPLMMTMRSTNVYEDRSLFVQPLEQKPDEEPDTHESRAVWGRFLGTHIRNQLAYDLWWAMIALWVVLLCEKDKVEAPEYSNMTMFGVIFEIMSAYATVGMSYGATTKSASLAGDMSVLSKLVLIAVMLRGRHRNLPSAIDRAVMLPHDMQRHDELHDMSPALELTATKQSERRRRTSTTSSQGTHALRPRRTLTRTHTAAPRDDDGAKVHILCEHPKASDDAAERILHDTDGPQPSRAFPVSPHTPPPRRVDSPLSL